MDTFIETDPKTARLQFAVSQGIEEDKLRQVQVELAGLREDGILIDLEVHGTSIFSRTANWLELGVIDEITREKHTRGRRRLIDEKQEKRLKSIESSLRRTLKEYSYDVPGFRPYRYVPWKAYGKWREKHDALVAQFDDLKVEILSNYEAYVDQSVSDTREIAHAAWISIRGQGFSTAEVNGEVYTSLAEFEQMLVDEVLGRIPSYDQISAMVYVDYIPGIATGSSELEADHLLAAQMRAQQSDLKRAAAENDYQAATMGAKIDAYKQAELEHARQRLLSEGSPLVKMTQEFMAKIAEDIEKMLVSVRKNGHVRGKTAELGHSLIEFYEIMASVENGTLRSKLQELKETLGPVGGGDTAERDIDKIEVVLQDLSAMIEAEITDLVTIDSVELIVI